MAGYDPKQKRAHSTAKADEHAPVDDLLGPPPVPVPDPDVAPETVGPEVAQDPTPVTTPMTATRVPAAAKAAPHPASSGPDPKVLALVAAAVAAVLLWRWRRR